jgi:hypothetical protein
MALSGQAYRMAAIRRPDRSAEGAQRRDLFSAISR